MRLIRGLAALVVLIAGPGRGAGLPGRRRGQPVAVRSRLGPAGRRADPPRRRIDPGRAGRDRGVDRLGGLRRLRDRRDHRGPVPSAGADPATGTDGVPEAGVRARGGRRRAGRRHSAAEPRLPGPSDPGTEPRRRGSDSCRSFDRPATGTDPSSPGRTNGGRRRLPKADGTRYTVERGDDLWSLAERFYGEGRDWRKIAAANPDLLTGGPDRLEPGWRPADSRRRATTVGPDGGGGAG